MQAARRSQQDFVPLREDDGVNRGVDADDDRRVDRDGDALRELDDGAAVVGGQGIVIVDQPVEVRTRGQSRQQQDQSDAAHRQEAMKGGHQETVAAQDGHDGWDRRDYGRAVKRPVV
jgi:hypothetical protein